MTVQSALTRGVGVYTDPRFSQVNLLIQAIGSGPSIVDRSSSGWTLSKYGTVTQSSAGRFGMAGFTLPASPGSTAHYVRTPADAGLHLVGNKWAVEARFTLSAMTTSSSGSGLPLGQTIFGLMGSVASWSSSTGARFLILVDDLGKLNFYWNAGGSGASVQHASTLTTGVEYYVRLSHDNAGTLKFECNGVESSHSSVNITPLSSASDAWILVGNSTPSNPSESSWRNLRGTVWGVRVTKGGNRPLWIGHRSMPWPVNRGTFNSYTPGDGTPAPESEKPKGQYVATTDGTWTVPFGVNKVCIVCIGMRVKQGATTVVQAQPGAIVGNGSLGGTAAQPSSWIEYQWNPDQGGGGGGGAFGGGGPAYIPVEVTVANGGGGCGGYGATGGNGGDISPRPNGAGRGGRNWSLAQPGEDGAGASLLGVVPGGGALYGGGRSGTGGSYTSEDGRTLAYINDLAVTPGQTLSIESISGGQTKATRIMWGGGRSFPNAAQNV